MTDLTIQISDDILNRLQDAAERQHLDLSEVVREAIENYLDEEEEPTKDELLGDLRQSMLDALAGHTYPADEVMADLRRKYLSNDDNG
jgi:predicted transcriptional regulator